MWSLNLPRRRGRIVLGEMPHLTRPVWASKPHYQVQGHINARGHPCCGDRVTVIDEPFFAPHINGGVQLGQPVQRSPVLVAGPSEKSGGGIDQ